MNQSLKHRKRYRRHRRIRAKVYGTARRPRLCVFRSAKHIYAQLVNDEKGQTLIAASDLELKRKNSAKKPKITRPELVVKKGIKDKEKERTRKVAVAFEVGKLIAEKALKKKIEKVVFDRGGYKYHGRVKSLAEGAREGGLKF